eukprot:GFUD01024095.1.p1 GENE.GFUD01024095.1~~GFUD01024095.1.p1  ORF type:complete len:265 (-),score=77.90 GFUD01024095.1:78-872(-)
MHSLRTLCLLKVSSLKLSYEAGDIPITLNDELKMMLLFNGHFFGEEIDFYADLFEGVIEVLKEQVLTVQYQGEGTWAFGICHKCDTCSEQTCDGEGRCGKQPEKLHFVVKENKTCDSAAVFAIVRGLSRFSSTGFYDGLMKKYKASKQVSTVLSVETGNVPDSGQLVFSSSLVLETGQEVICKFQVNSTLDDSPVFKYSRTVGDQGREIPLLLTECQVPAMEAFPEPVTACEYIDGDLTVSQDEEESEESEDQEEREEEEGADE